jgi:glutamate-1-semialdehyde 2,1-aminomutase
LICDEVITGFRVAYGGAQHIYGIDPDITCLGKIIGGGFAIGAFGGKRKIMESLAPLGDTYQAGTLSGNPVAVRAGIYTLQYLRDHKENYGQMNHRMEAAKKSILEIARTHNIPYRINSTTGMFTGFFSERDVNDYESATACDRKAYERFFKLMLDEGIFFAPSQFEASIVTLCHKEKEIFRTVESYEKVFRAMSSS